MAGNRDDDWGKEKKFREGQADQVLDTLFFDFIELAKKLQPKIVVAENVKGLLLGEAKSYVLKIYQEFEAAGYYVRHWLLNGSDMGVPQRRERVFFLAIRNDIADPFLEQFDMFSITPKINLDFNEPKIPFGDFKDEMGRDLSDNMKVIWNGREQGDSSLEAACVRIQGKHKYFSQSYLYVDKVAPTLTSHEDALVLFDAPKYTSKNEACKIGSYPLDYNFMGNKPHYLIGMSVPPIMTAQIASRIYEQWLSKI